MPKRRCHDLMEQTNLSSEVPEGTGELVTTLPTDEPMPTPVVETPSASPALGQIAEPIKKREGKVDITPKGQIRFYATGRRKEAIARVWLIPGGTGQVTVNGRPLLDYVTRLSLAEEVLTPLRVTNTLGLFDVWATVAGGWVARASGRFATWHRPCPCRLEGRDASLAAQVWLAHPRPSRQRAEEIRTQARPTGLPIPQALGA